MKKAAKDIKTVSYLISLPKVYDFWNNFQLNKVTLIAATFSRTINYVNKIIF